MRLILDMSDPDSLLAQVQAARTALDGGIDVGNMWGVKTNGKFFGVKRNKGSIRVYPQGGGS